jgi:hypothetical protein
MARLYPRWDSFEGRLFSTADFAWSRSGRFKLGFGVDLRLRARLPRFMNWGLHVPAVEYVAISKYTLAFALDLQRV